MTDPSKMLELQRQVSAANAAGDYDLEDKLLDEMDWLWTKMTEEARARARTLLERNSQ